MKRILKSIAPYWKEAILVLLLLVVQAVCDLSLPQYTSNIIDTGIQNGGIEHIVPDKITSEEFEYAKLAMTDEEIDKWNSIYDKSDSVYTLKVTDSKELDELDSYFSLPLVFINQMESASLSDMLGQFSDSGDDSSSSVFSSVSSIDDIKSMAETILKLREQFNGMDMATVSQMLAMSNGGQASESLSVEYIQMIFSMSDEELEAFEFLSKIDENTNPLALISVLVKAGFIESDTFVSARDSLQSTFDTMGDSMVKSMGISYAKKQLSLAGEDMDKLQINYLWAAGARMIGMAFIIMAAMIGVGFMASRIGAGIGRDMREAVYKNVMSYSNAEIDKFSTASLITRTTNDITQVQTIVIMLLRLVLYAPIVGIGGVIKVANTGAGMGWIIILAIVCILGLVAFLMAVAMPKFKLMQTLIDNVNLISREILTGLQVIRAFKREDKEEDRFDKANVALTNNSLFTGRCMAFMMPAMMLIMNGLSILIVWVSADRIDSGVMQVGTMTAFITYAMTIVISFLMLTVMSIMLPRAIVAANRIDEVMNTKTSIADPVNPVKMDKIKGEIAFDNVSFKFPGATANAIENISFTASPGKTTAIIGSTGCGKSTLVNLIPRLYDVTEGKITLDGVDIRDISMHDLRNSMGYAAQKGVLFTGTINSNIKFADDNISDEEAKAAAKIAQAEEFIIEKEEKYESHIAQGGANVSGGQKQRLSIARAIAKKPAILIFDDTFSALDLKTDAKLRKALSESVKDSTVIIVAQRISTIIHADEILVMDDGRIVERGNNEELLALNGIYREVYDSQTKSKEVE